jgi:hypothetical protein
MHLSRRPAWRLARSAECHSRLLGPANRAGDALRLARSDSGDVVAAAKAAGVRITEYHVMVARARAAVERLGARVAKAQRAGDLGYINREYKRRRQEAQAEGRPFMPYRAAQARLRKALVGVAAGDRPHIIARVFDDRLPDPR